MKANTTLIDRPYTIEKLLGLERSDPTTLTRQIESGLKFEALEKLSRATGLSAEKLRPALRIRPRTMSRRRVEKRLSPEESDRLISISRLLALTFELFEGDAETAIQWFTTPKRIFGGLTPLDMATTETGSREVENLIGQLEHGVFP
jgi:putative toxin-antitoxin system antitoxin component (TIGR02293 family)